MASAAVSIAKTRRRPTFKPCNMRMPLAQGAIIKTSRSPAQASVKPSAIIPVAPSAVEPTPETTKPAPESPSTADERPASTITRVRAKKMANAAPRNSTTAHQGSPVCHSHKPMTTRPPTKPTKAVR